jgi:hypothetical protein
MCVGREVGGWGGETGGEGGFLCVVAPGAPRGGGGGGGGGARGSGGKGGNVLQQLLAELQHVEAQRVSAGWGVQRVSAGCFVLCKSESQRTGRNPVVWGLRKKWLQQLQA